MMNKKAVSLMVSYVLLVIIAIGISVLVYPYLKGLLPSERPECPSDISLTIEKASCTLNLGGGQEDEFNITFSNRGLFNVSAAFIRIGLEGRTVRQQVNTESAVFPFPMPPTGDAFVYSYDITSMGLSTGDYVVEVQPAIIDRRDVIPCDAIVTQKVYCSP